MSLAITTFPKIEREPGMCSRISSQVWSKHGIVDIKSAAFSGCILLQSIPRGGDSWLFPKIGFIGFFLEWCCKDGLATIESIHRFRFKHKAMGSWEIKPIRSWCAVTVVLLRSKMMICEGTDRYQIQWVEGARQPNRHKHVSTGGFVLDKPNRKQNKIRNNIYILSRDVCTFNFTYAVIGLVLL